MNTVEFKFKIGDKVKTDLDEPGIVEELMQSKGSKCAYVRTKYSSSWIDEDNLVSN